VVKRFLFLDGGQFPVEWISLAAGALDGGSVVVHPTETVHGFGCRWDCREAAERIVRMKGRDPGKSMLFLVPDLNWVERLTTGLSPESIQMVEKFWPGPLTLVFQASESVRKECPWLGETVGPPAQPSCLYLAAR
jgi:L-threonylcarbamoyladenylate synthase